VKAALSGDFATARTYQYQLFDVYSALFEEGNPGGVKEILQYLNICSNHMRLPLVPVSSAHSKKLYQLIAENGLK
ncbi:MAG: dihydrodipicolinate synthase family protein, partial [Bacteroidota bacterium]